MKFTRMGTALAVATLVSGGAVAAAGPASAGVIYGSWTGSTKSRCAAATAAGLGYEAAQGSQVSIISYCRFTHGVGYVTKVRIVI
ncbi:hypothetical protein [Terracoccus luteus]|uniref:Lactococcin 972 family bacteriocin n=1 Tax=Terracoccus luteus TaxID=53356 RepID=A0A495Y3G1_9MICO|nr:hypothetical protein [Terracoccus luteus]MBB2987385.1 hypothetical protein [Terracoccus luteus]MCP2173036.1 hypothetical protein [Terracoccus luteus]RKT79786.1 hypothetical protein DFJ68_3264 [Terracoccus luteus]